MYSLLMRQPVVLAPPDTSMSPTVSGTCTGGGGRDFLTGGFLGGGGGGFLPGAGGFLPAFSGGGGDAVGGAPAQAAHERMLFEEPRLVISEAVALAGVRQDVPEDRVIGDRAHPLQLKGVRGSMAICLGLPTMDYAMPVATADPSPRSTLLQRSELQVMAAGCARRMHCNGHGLSMCPPCMPLLACT
jgi:hypothetical protein